MSSTSNSTKNPLAIVAIVLFSILGLLVFAMFLLPRPFNIFSFIDSLEEQEKLSKEERDKQAIQDSIYAKYGVSSEVTELDVKCIGNCWAFNGTYREFKAKVTDGDYSDLKFRGKYSRNEDGGGVVITEDDLSSEITYTKAEDYLRDSILKHLGQGCNFAQDFNLRDDPDIDWQKTGEELVSNYLTNLSVAVMPSCPLDDAQVSKILVDNFSAIHPKQEYVFYRVVALEEEKVESTPSDLKGTYKYGCHYFGERPAVCRILVTNRE